MVRNHVRRLGIHIVPLVAYSRRVSVPVVVGILRPMILLPIGLGSGLTLPQLETILIHELAHIRRFDLAINLLQRLIEALLFFHPAVWWLSRRISIERENACDDTVLRSYCRGIQYADALVRMAELCEAFASNSIGNSAATTASLAANGRNASQFKRRVQRLLGVAEEPRLRLSVLGVLISLAMLSSVVLTPVSWLVAENAMVTECPRLTDVLFVGCEEISRKTLQRECGMKAGDPVDPHAAEEARRTLETFYQEKGFRNVRVALLEGDRPTDKRAVFLINEQVAQRQYEIDFAGCTAINSEKLHRVLKDNSRHILFGVGVRSSAGLVGEATIDRQLDREQMDKDQKRLLAYYRSLGFFKAHIGVEPTYNEKGNGVTITHVINEGPRFKIRNVSVVGNTQYSSEELMADMKLKSSDYFDQSKADADRRLIADKYGSIGYVYADVRPDNLLLEQPGSMDVVYTIKEGSRYRVGRIDIDIKGDCPHTQVYTVLNQLAFKPGDIVDTRKIRESEMRLKSSDLIGVNGEHYSTVKIAWAPVAAQEPDQTEANLNVCIFAVP
jgi:hypothetical protein